MPPTLAARLWAENEAVADACLRHPFVRGIATGQLPVDRFAAYVAQDALFLDGFARAYALCLAKAPDRRSMEIFRGLLDGVFDELRLHAAYAAQWGVDVSGTVEPSAATAAYVDFLLRVAALEPVVNACAAMTPCMRLYAWLGRSLGGEVVAGSPFISWVETYSSPEFEELALSLENLLDELSAGAAGDGGAAGGVLADHYRKAMHLEYSFFDAMAPAGGEVQ